jgi:hypothetical protein
MSVKNVGPADLILIALLKTGTTDAAAATLEALQTKGRITMIGGIPMLTPKGYRRAEALAEAAHDIEALYAPVVQASGDAEFNTVSGCRLRMSGGLARIEL